MDVDMQMEASGLPTEFGSTSEKPTEPITADTTSANLDVAQPNSESSNLPVPLKPSTAQISPVPESTSAPADHLPQMNGYHLPNGTSEQDERVGDTSLNGSVLTLVPNSQPSPMAETSQDKSDPSISMLAQPLLTPVPAIVSEPAVSSSIPSEIPSSEPTVGSVTDSIPLPTQAPLSDLRSPPHADRLPPEEVAKIEEEKHRMDNAAEITPMPSQSEPIQPPIAPMVESASVSKIGLATPPSHTPPPPPEPAPATLPIETAQPPPQEPAPPSVPAENPVEPTPTPAVEMAESAPVPTSATIKASAPVPAPAPVSTSSIDQLMTDAPFSPGKVARERDEDDRDAEPLAKRAKTEESRQASEPADFKIPDRPSLSTATPKNESAIADSPVDNEDAVSSSRLAHMKKVISNLKKSNASQAFRLPVDPVALGIPTYPSVVKRPMDLGTIDNKLKHNQYRTVADFISDFELIVNNCLLFNGSEHLVTQQAVKMQSSFNNQMSHLPGPDVEEPTKEQKKAARLKIEPTRTAPPRRPSVSTTNISQPGSARSPKTAPQTPSFAVGPDGIPLIRRDSNMNDGRPKRAIVPTKRNQDISGGRPRKKKYELQLRFCQEVLKEIANPKHWQINQYFTHPVDPVALNIPTYFQIIRKPMDLSTIQVKLDNNEYEKAKDFEEDVRQIFKNCFKFNPDGDFVNQCGHQLEELFNKKWATKEDWIAAREPPSDPQSDAEEEDDEEDASEEEDADSSGEERNAKIALLQKQIAEMSKQMGELTQTQSKKPKKKSKSPSSKKAAKAKPGKKEKAGPTFPNLGKTAKKEKKSGTKSKADKDRYVTFAEKQYISHGIALLPEKQMQEALKIIQSSVPSLANSDQNEIELDIEEVPNHALLKLLNFVKKYAGPPPDEPKADSSAYNAPAAVSKSKKNKPMSKHEQEAQIEELKGKLGAYAGPVSPNAVQSIETGDDSSDDEADSEESEEE